MVFDRQIDPWSMDNSDKIITQEEFYEKYWIKRPMTDLEKQTFAFIKEARLKNKIIRWK